MFKWRFDGKNLTSEQRRDVTKNLAENFFDLTSKSKWRVLDRKLSSKAWYDVITDFIPWKLLSSWQESMSVIGRNTFKQNHLSWSLNFIHSDTMSSKKLIICIAGESTHTYSNYVISYHFVLQLLYFQGLPQSLATKLTLAQILSRPQITKTLKY